jgi:hypothetical protein
LFPLYHLLVATASMPRYLGDLRVVGAVRLTGVLISAAFIAVAQNGPFETSVRPILAKQCFQCHADNVQTAVDGVLEEPNTKSLPVNYPSPSAGVPADFGEHARLMTDLLVLAFQTNLTRISTVLLSIEQSPRAYGAEIGIPKGHHGLTHRSGDGTLADHSMIVYGSGISAGNRHDQGNLPAIIAGRGDGTLKPGRHIRYSSDTPRASLFVSMLHRMGIEFESFGDSKDKLDRLSI